MKDIYKGTLGLFFNRNEIEYKLLEYLTEARDLSYEFRDDKVNIAIITGQNNKEKNLPYWEHPLIVRPTSDTSIVVINIMPFMQVKLNDLVTVTEKLSDRYNGKLQLMRTVFTRKYIVNSSWLTYVNPYIMQMFGNIISGLVSQILYDSKIKEELSTIAMMHYITMDDNNDKLTIDEVIERLPMRLITRLKHGDLKDFYNYLKAQDAIDNLIFPSRTIGDLVNNIKNSLVSGKAKHFSSDLLVQVLSRGFYSFNSKELSIGFIEHLPTTISILYFVITEGINNRFVFRSIIERNRTILKPKEFTEIVKRLYNEEIITLGS